MPKKPSKARRLPPTFTGGWIPIEDRSPAAQRLIAARKAAGLTQTDLAYLLGVAQPVIACIETGRHNVSEVRLAEILATIAQVQR
jgi:predicted transcriptional regulator